MRAIVITRHGGPEVLEIAERPDPAPTDGHVLIEVKAFGVNHAETHMRMGEWPEWTEISGIECAGVVRADPSGRLRPGQTVVAFMGGMGRSISGAYAELVNPPATNVIPVETSLAWPDLAAIPESYATAWMCLMDNLALQRGQTLVIRGATSALGRAAVNIAADAGAEVIATSRKPARLAGLESLGARRALLEASDLPERVRTLHPGGVDAVLELVGNSTVLASLGVVRRGGRLCEAGWLGGLAPIEAFNPMLQLPSGVHYSLFGSFVFGSPQFPVSDVPMQRIVEKAETGVYQAKPAHVFGFDQIVGAHRLMESGLAEGKIVVAL